MGIKTVQDTSLTSVANAIRVKAEISGTLEFPDEFVSAIQNISTGITPSGTKTITENGTYDVTNFASADVNVSGGGGSDAEDSIVERTISGEYTNSRVTKIGMCAFAQCDNLLAVNLPNATNIENFAFSGCKNLATASVPNAEVIGASAFSACSALSAVNFPKAETIGAYAFVRCVNLATASLPNASIIYAYAFSRCSKLLSVYMLGSRFVQLSSNAFSATPITGSTASTGGVYGSVFVPASLYNHYCSAQYWSNISARIVSLTDAEIAALE